MYTVADERLETDVSTRKTLTTLEITHQSIHESSRWIAEIWVNRSTYRLDLDVVTFQRSGPPPGHKSRSYDQGPRHLWALNFPHNFFQNA